MLNYSERIEILRLVGNSLDTEDYSASNNLDQEIETLKQQIEDKKSVLEYLDEKMDSCQTDLDVQCELDNHYTANMKEDIRGLKDKSELLETYIAVLTNPNSDEFPVMKLTAEMENYCQMFWAKLKPFHDRSKAIASQLAELRDLRDRYMEAKQRADNSMI